jgi:alpha-ketoglutarate-dependent taurine dioxygenase
VGNTSAEGIKRMKRRVFGESWPSLTVEPLAPYGAIITGVDINEPLSPTQVGDLKACLYQYHVLVFRGHEAPDDAHYIELLGNFGTPYAPIAEVAGSQGTRPDAPQIIMLTSKVFDENGQEVGYVQEGPRGLGWHTDYCWADRVSEIGALDACVVTTQGGETCFANMYAVYDALDPETKEKLNKATGVHELRTEDAVDGVVRRAEHPVVITNPYNGRRAVYVNSLYTIGLLGLANDEAEELLNYLFDFSMSPQFRIDHFWHKDDLLVWDQIGLVHCRKPFNEAEPRHMRQISLEVESINSPWPMQV